MPELPVFDRNGEKVGTYSIESTDVAPRISKQLLHDAVVMYQANLRQGSAKTKSRAEVSGSTKKMYRQKGTGNARAGSKRSNVRRGGGNAFAHRPRDYSYRLPKKAVRLATRMALASKIEDDQLVVIDELKFEEPKTSEMASILKALDLDGKSVLITTSGYDINVYKSGRNIARVSVSPVSELNALNVLKPRHVLVTKEALDAIKSGNTAAKNGSSAADAETKAASEAAPQQEAGGEEADS